MAHSEPQALLNGVVALDDGPLEELAAGLRREWGGGESSIFL